MSSQKELSLAGLPDEDLASLYHWCNMANYVGLRYGIGEFVEVYENFFPVVEDEICERFCTSA